MIRVRVVQERNTRNVVGENKKCEVLRMVNRFSEKDWKLFRKKLPDWQEAYMDKLNKEYIELLSAEGNASDKFWTLEKRIRQDKKDCGVQCEMSRSNQFYNMLSLLNEGAITLDDLEEFSDDLKEMMAHFYKQK